MDIKKFISKLKKQQDKSEQVNDLIAALEQFDKKYEHLANTNRQRYFALLLITIDEILRNLPSVMQIVHKLIGH